MSGPLGAAERLSGDAHVIRSNLRYGPERLNSFDLYLPAGGEAPLVMYVHGGGWRFGNKIGGRPAAEALSRAGFAVASITYRRLPQHTARDAANDVALAAAFLLGQAGRFGYRPGSVLFVGHSAGGHLAALVAIDPAYAAFAGLDLSQLRGVVTLDGVFDLRRRIYDKTFGELSSAERSGLSPVSLVGSMVSHASFGLIHGDGEPRFASDAAVLAELLVRSGRRASVYSVADYKHLAFLRRFEVVAELVAGCLGDALGDKTVSLSPLQPE